MFKKKKKKKIYQNLVESASVKQSFPSHSTPIGVMTEDRSQQPPATKISDFFELPNFFFLIWKVKNAKQDLGVEGIFPRLMFPKNEPRVTQNFLT